MQALCARLRDSAGFRNTIIGLIVLNGITLGLETSPAVTGPYGAWLDFVNDFVLVVFIAEVVIKMIAEWPRPWEYFKSGWNIFDFSIVAFSLLPATGDFAMVARLLRLLRVMRLISTLPELRLIVNTVIRTIPSMLHVVILLSVLFYIYGVAGYHAFHEHDPTHWRNLGISLLTLFRIVTLEDWTDVMYAGMSLHPMAWLYFVSFVVIGTFMILNLFIAVLLNNLESAKIEFRKQSSDPISRAELLDAIRNAENTLKNLQERIEIEFDERAPGEEGSRAAPRPD